MNYKRESILKLLITTILTLPDPDAKQENEQPESEENKQEED